MIYHNHRSLWKPNPSPWDTEEAWHLDDLEVTVAEAVEDLGSHLHEFDSMIVTGTSGIVVGVPLMQALGKPVVILRKRNDGSHSGSRYVNSKHLGARTLFVDDFISAGNTKQRVIDELAELRDPPVLVAHYMYRDRQYDVLDSGIVLKRKRELKIERDRKKYEYAGIREATPPWTITDIPF